MATVTIITGSGTVTQTISTGARGPAGPPGSSASITSYVTSIASLPDYPTSFPTTPADIGSIGGNKLIGRHNGTSGEGQEIGIDGGLTFQGGNLKVDLATTPSTWRTELGLGSLATLSTVTLTSDVTGTLPIANGGTGGTTAATARASIQGGANPFNFILVGDSIMAGVTTGGATSPFFLANLLPTKSYFAGRATIINRGVPGRTTTQILADWQTGANTDPWAWRPSNQGGTRAIVLVCAGINDWNNAASMTTALSNMTTYVSNLKAAGFEVWLGIPLPASNGGNADYVTRTGMKAYIRGLRSLTTPDKKIDFHQLVHNMTGTGSGAIWTGDSLHPNNTLYSTMADFINLKAWGDDALAAGTDLGTMAFQDSDAVTFDGVASFLSSPSRTANSGTTAEYVARVSGAGSNRQVKFGHTSVPNGNVPANGFVVSIWNGSSWSAIEGLSQEGVWIGNGMRMVPKTVATLPANPTTNTFATVTDAASFSAGSTVTGGGSTKCMVQYTGSAWVMVMQLY